LELISPRLLLKLQVGFGVGGDVTMSVSDDVGNSKQEFTQKPGVFRSVRDAFTAYLERGYQPVLIPPVDRKPTKGPRGTEWQNKRYTHADAHLFTDTNNIGLNLGEPSGGLCDIDCDCAEAVLIASYLLPKTGLRGGRPTAVNRFDS
jgi:hypothetical protein